MRSRVEAENAAAPAQAWGPGPRGRGHCRRSLPAVPEQALRPPTPVPPPPQWPGGGESVTRERPRQAPVD